ncbi:MAG: GAF domain-containing protein [Chloroflexi bacterium]|nr:GAF domain-containing protein [Chloroflexota bacterium]
MLLRHHLASPEVRQAFAELRAAESRRQQRAEQSLRESEARFTAAFHANPAGILISAVADGRIVEVNDSCLRIVGYTRGELIAHSAFALNLWAEPAAYARVVQDLRERRTRDSVELALRAKSGETRVALATLQWVTLDGEPCVIALLQDISERKRAEQALRASTTLLESTFDSLSEAVLVVDSATRTTVSCNQAVAKVFGYTPAEVIGRNTEFLHVSRERYEEFGRWLFPALDTCGVFEGEFQMRRKDGGVFLSEHTVKAIYDETGRRIRVVSVVRDITKRKQAEAEIRRQAARAEALAHAAARLNAQLDLEAVLKAICEETARALNAQAATVTLCDDQKNLMVVVACVGLPPEYQRQHTPVPRAAYDAAVQRFGPMQVVRDTQARPDMHNARLYAAYGIRTFAYTSMIREGQLIGTLQVYSLGAVREFSADELSLLQGLADEAAQAIVNARLLSETRRRAEEFAALYEVSHDLTVYRDLPGLLKTLVERAVALLRGSDGGILLYDAARRDLELVVMQHQAITLYPRQRIDEGLAGLVFQTRKPLIVDDYQNWPQRRLQFEGLPIRAVVAVPMLYRQELIGVLFVEDSNRDAPPDQRSREATLPADVRTPASAVVNTRLFEAEQRARQVAETVREANLALTRTLDLPTVLETLLTNLQRLIPYDSANVMLLDDHGARLTVRAARGYQRWGMAEQALALVLDVKTKPILQKLIASRQSVWLPDTHAQPGWDRQVRVGEHVRGWLGVPLVAGGQVIGLYSLDKAEAGFFREEHVRLAEMLAAPAAVAIENAILFEQARASREQLQALSHQLVGAQEAERKRMARELHDEIGQALTGLKLALEISTRLPPEGARAHLDNALASVQDLIARVRDLSRQLRPPVLDDLGLVPALRSLFERYTAQTGVEVHFHHSGLLEQRLPPDGETAAYRIVQEALTNAARHAQVGQVMVDCRLKGTHGEPGELHIEVEDRGVGFDVPAALGASASRGLVGMRERAALLGGQWVMESAPGAGTRMKVVLPLENHSA